MRASGWRGRASRWLILATAISFSAPMSRAQTATTDAPPATESKPGIRFDYHFPTGKQRLHTFLSGTLGIRASLQSALLAATNHFDNAPPEWGPGARGYGRRVASQFGRLAIKNGIEYGLGTAFRRDTEYRRCECTGILRRLRHAVSADFVARRQDGSRTFTMIKVASYYGGGMIPMVWYPPRNSALRDGLRLGTMSFAFGTGMNVLREFWPQIRTLFRR